MKMNWLVLFCSLLTMTAAFLETDISHLRFIACLGGIYMVIDRIEILYKRDWR